MIVEQPVDPYDVAGWRAALARLREARPGMPADEYDSQHASLMAGLSMALRGPTPTPEKPRSIRERLSLWKSA